MRSLLPRFSVETVRGPACSKVDKVIIAGGMLVDGVTMACEHDMRAVVSFVECAAGVGRAGHL